MTRSSRRPLPPDPGSATLRRLGSFAIRWRRAVLLVAGVLIALFAVVGFGVMRHLSQGGFDAPGSESTRAATVLAEEFHSGAPNLVLLVTATRGTLDSPAVARAGSGLTRLLASQPHVANVESYWSLEHASELRSGSREAIVVARILGDQNQVIAREPAVVAPIDRVGGPISVEVGGFAPTFVEVDKQVEHGLLSADLIALPVTFVLLLFVYGSVVSAALPLAVGAVSVLGTLFVLRLIAGLTSVSIFSEDLTTALGLGLAIDYSLFIVSRFREELAAGQDPDEAVLRTVATAGKTVVGSSMTVAGALAVLLVFPMVFLRSFAFAGIPVALFSGVAAVVLLPAVLSLLGRRVNALTLWRRSVVQSGEGFWSRLSGVVMGHPIVFLVGTLAILGLLASPFLGLRLGYLDYRVLPPGNHVRAVDARLTHDFGQGTAEGLTVVAPRVPGAEHSAPRDRLIDAYAARLSRVGDVEMVAAETGVFVHGSQLPAPASYADQFANPRGTWLSVVPSIDALQPAGEVLVHQVRDVPAPFGVLVGGMPAENVDATRVILSRLPIALGLIAAISFGVLLLMFGSLLIALKAVVLNVLSLAATFGAMVWVFQEGHLSSLLGFTATGNVLATIPLLMFCVAFGLSMDYEVFLISRIKEQHDLGADNARAVARGLQRTGRIVTAAALTMTVVFLAVTTSGIAFIKLFGLGLTLAVLLDAFVVRGMLVPAFMRLAGRANWWAPALARRAAARRAPRSGPEPVGAPRARPLTEWPDQRRRPGTTTAATPG